MTVTKNDMLWTAWGITSFAFAASLIAWGETIRWDVAGLNNYQLFPLFGLMAYTLMWSHYIVSALRLYFKFDSAVTARYFEITSLLALIAIFLHPGLLIWQLWRDGEGIPPLSYYHYVVGPLRWLTVLGSVSWLVFVAYEFRRKYKTRGWWKYVQYASDIAMVAVFYHGLQLGGDLRSGWFRFIWLLLGFTLLASIMYMYTMPTSTPRTKKTKR